MLHFRCVYVVLQLNAIEGLSYLGALLSKLDANGMVVSTFLYRYWLVFKSGF